MKEETYENEMLAVSKMLPKGRPCGGGVFIYRCVNSTQQVARDFANRGYKEAIIAAKEQTTGRGRLDRHWESPPNSGLYVSFLLRPHLTPQQLQLISLAAGLAVEKYLRTRYAIPLGLKWPNDILYDDRKLCGILSETAFISSEIKYCITGIGINCKKIKLNETDTWRTCSLDEFADNVNLSELLAGVACELYSHIELLENGDTKKILEEYQSRCVTIGRDIIVEINGRTVCGIARELGANGELIVDTGNETFQICAGEVIHARNK